MHSPGLLAQVACLWEVTARKPGNVHRGQDFPDLAFSDFLLSAAAIGPAFDLAPSRPVGQTVLDAIQATRRVVHTNTNLGIVLLLAPLAAVPQGQDLRAGVEGVLQPLTLADSRNVFEAIRLANPGGLGTVPAQDVRAEPSLPLREIMALAAERDLVARQYANGFQEVFDVGLPALRVGLPDAGTLEDAIITCFLHLLASHPDSLIARKLGHAEAEEASQRARLVLAGGWPAAAARLALAALDAWLRAAGTQRNPGTTADLVTACLFAALRDGIIPLPPAFPWSG